MFRFHKTLDVLTLFHAPASTASKRILETLRSSPTAHKKSFELDVVEAPTVPTPTQLTSILEFIGKNRVGEVVPGARSEGDAVRLLKVEEAGRKEGGGGGMVRPLLVDWNNGRAVVGGDEGAVLRLLETLPGN
ncbi:thioredoxin-like protein [Tuber borchii]|uniref:Thioredoxin-like protein n=1 Tax=Tuber borchii TaxID=42251 RepID=A0A2T6ZPX1_TUBBO|nr:thioredoxin-like protein [Tuber borchii]